MRRRDGVLLPRPGGGTPGVRGVTLQADVVARTKLPRLADRLALGSGGLRVSPCCVGMVEDPATIAAAFDLGVNFFFVSSDMHWPLYEAARRGLERLLARGGAVRDEIVVAGVCYPTQPEFCSFPFRELVDAVPGLGRLDVLLAGGAYGSEVGTRLPVYERHREERFLGNRAIGVTFHDRVAAATALQRGGLDIAFVRYNADHASARDDLFPHVPERPRPLLFNFKSTSGFVPPVRMAEIGLVAPDYWQPEVTDHYRFAFTRPQLDGLLVSPRTPREVEGIAAALARGPLTDEEETYLIDVAAVARGAARVRPEGETT